MKIKNVVVIGSGTMGSGIAAHLCNANIPVTLLDLKTDGGNIKHQGRTDHTGIRAAPGPVLILF